MKKLLMSALSLMLLPYAWTAQAQTLEEHVYTFMPTESDTPFDLSADCENNPKVQLWSIEPTLGARFDLYSVQTKKTNGKLLKAPLKKVGELLTCQNWDIVFPPDGSVPQQNLIPLFYQISVDGMEIVAEGGAILPAGFPPIPFERTGGGGQLMNIPGYPWFPATNAVLLGTTASVLPPLPGGLGSSPPVVGGTYVANSVVDLAVPGIPPSPFPTAGIHTLRLYTIEAE